MSWASSARGIAVLATAVLAPQAASAAIIVASSGPTSAQFPAGKRLSDSARITLKAGDAVTVLDQRGTKVLRGPGRFAVSQPGRALPNPSFAILTRPQNTRIRIAATRTGEDGKLMSPNLWFVDVNQLGKQCITNPSTVWFWRAEASRTAHYRVARADMAPTTVSFAARSQLASWNTASAPIGEGASYAVLGHDGSALGQVTFTIMVTPPNNPIDLMASLIARGCSAQVRLLTQALAISRF